MHSFRVVPALLSLVMAAMDHAACGSESGVAAGPPLFRVWIKGGSAAVISPPSSYAPTTGWKHPCVLDLENRDAERREVSLDAALPVRIILPEARIVLEPNQTNTVTFLMQSLTLDEHDAWRAPLAKPPHPLTSKPARPNHAVPARPAPRRSPGRARGRRDAPRGPGASHSRRSRRS